MLEAALAAFRQILTSPFRSVLFKSIGLTLALMALMWIALDKLALSFVIVKYPWLQAALTFATGAGLVMILAFLIAPVSILVAGFFLDDLAAIVEREVYPAGVEGRPLPAAQALGMSLRFALVSAGVNLLALTLLFLPGVNAIAFLLANAYLFGREYFALAATRFRPAGEAEDLRSRFSPQLFFAGLFIAGFVAVPGLNLLTPLFGVAFMVRIHKMFSPEWRGVETPRANALR